MTTVSLFQWRVVIGIFNCRVSLVPTNCECKLRRNFITMLEILLLCYYYLKSTYMSSVALLYIFILLQCHGNIFQKSRSKKTKKNLSQSAIGIVIITCSQFLKTYSLEAYISVYKNDFISLSETYLDSPVPDSLLEIDGYNLVHVYYSNDTKIGGVCNLY